jgi:hypothetical protein
MGAIVGDLAHTWHIDDWIIQCVSCPKRLTGLSYNNLPPLYYEEDGIFAWNRDHLLFIADSLYGRDISGNPYVFLRAYIHGDWLRHKKKSISIIKKLLSRGIKGEQETPPNR